jgi:hypothetical protein
LEDRNGLRNDFQKVWRAETVSGTISKKFGEQKWFSGKFPKSLESRNGFRENFQKVWRAETVFGMISAPF